MSIICIKSKDDNKNFKIFKGFGFEVLNIDNLEQTDNVIKKVIDNNYNTIVVSNEVASFSQDIITKYNKIDNVNIVISNR